MRGQDCREGEQHPDTMEVEKKKDIATYATTLSLGETSDGKKTVSIDIVQSPITSLE